MDERNVINLLITDFEPVEYFENRADVAEYLKFEINGNIVQHQDLGNSLPILLVADRPQAAVADKPDIVDENLV